MTAVRATERATGRHNGRVTRSSKAWLAGLGPGGIVLGVLRALEIDSDVIAVAALGPVVGAASIGGRRLGIRIGAVLGIAYAVALLAPFGHFRIGLTHDMLVLVMFMLAGAGAGELADRRNPESSKSTAADDGDPAALIRVVSHDLRNPLSTIRAASSDLLHGRDEEPGRREELLGLVVAETERLDRIVGNLLSAGRARAGRMVVDPGPESLHAVVRAAIDRLGNAHPQRVLNEVPVDLPAVMVDVVLLDQVLANLVENAARVSAPGSVIRIGAHHDDGTVAVTVRDDGTGFELGDADPFEAYVSASGSSGLGLAICRAIVTAHGGAIEIVDVPAGACVRFTLPVADLD